MSEKLPLFLYGTLLSGTGVSAIDRLVRRSLRPLARAYVPGRLYDLRSCPAALPEAGSRARIHGRLFALRRGPWLLAHLDHYEDCGLAFNRVIATAYTVPGRQPQPCWIYRYARPVNGRPTIVTGDYLAHRLRQTGKHDGHRR